MMVYGLVLVTVAAPFLVFGLGRPGMWASAGLVVLFLATQAASTLVGRHRSRRAFERGRCVRCDYDTRANSGRCPECGDELISHAAEYWRNS